MIREVGNQASNEVLQSNRQQRQHESNPELLKINADNQTSRRQIIHWGIFFGILLVTFILVNFLPNPIITIVDSQNPYCNNNSNNPIIIDKPTNLIGCENFDINLQDTKGILLLGMNPSNQYIVLSANFYLKNTSINLNYNNIAKLSWYSVIKNSKSQLMINSQLANNTNISYVLSTVSSTPFYSNNGTILGVSNQFAYIPSIQFTNYLFIINFPLTAEAISNLSNIELTVSTINPQFTTFSIVMRYIFFAISVVASFSYWLKIRGLSAQNIIIEQRFTLILSLLLISFNDPFYPLTVLKPNQASDFFSVFFVINMVCALLLFWICILERIHLENGSKQTKVIQYKKIVQISFTYLFVLGYQLYYSYSRASTPFVDLNTFSSGFFIFLTFCSVFALILCLLKILFLFFMIYKKYDEKIWRNKLFTNFSLFFVFCIFLFFFSNGFDIFSLFPNRIFLVYVEINMYVIYLMFMYSPTEQAYQRQNFADLNLFDRQSQIPQDIKTVEIIMPQQYEQFQEEQKYQVAQNQVDQKQFNKDKNHNQDDEMIVFEEVRKVGEKQFEIQ